MPGLYRHENGSYYGKKKILGVRKVAALTTPDGQNITERKAAESALRAWIAKLDKPTPQIAKESFGAWLEKLKILWGGKAESTVDKIDWTRRCFEMDLESQKGRGVKILETPIDEIKPSDLSAFFARRSLVLGANAHNEMSRIIKNTFELALNDGVIRESPYLKVPRTIRRKKIIRTPAQVPTIEQCESICLHVRTRISDTANQSADMLEFMHRAALGQAECILADWDKVKWESDYIEVRRQKTGAYFRVPLYAHLKPFLLEMWTRQGKPTSGPLFSILSPKQSLYNACRRLGLEDYSPIDFRKARITWMLRKGIPAEMIAKWQGHADNGVLIRKTYSWVISEADRGYELEQLAKLGTQ
ncbi:MAG: tyrosine-type recombinase/integrase [Chthoniobacter sp.]|nr:tyrosine-type recombinase/integrase [Chthoniobacter sp.]